MGIKLYKMRSADIRYNSELSPTAQDKLNFQQLASKYNNKALAKIQHFLEKGTIQINQTELPLPSRIKSQRKTKNGLQYLFKNQSKETERDEVHTSLDRKQLLSDTQRKRLIRKLAKEQDQMDRKRDRMVTEMKRKRQTELERENSIERQFKIRATEQRIKMLQQKSKEREDQILKREIELREANQRFMKVKNSKHLHEILEQKSNKSMLFMSLENKKKQLQERRELRKPMNMNDFKQFEKEYKKKKRQFELDLESKRNKNVPPKYEPPSKSDRLTQFLNQQMNEDHLRSEQKKRELQLKLKRFQDYSKYLRQNFKPQTDKRSATPILQIGRSGSRSKRDQRSLGNEYLKFSKMHTRMRNRSQNHSLETAHDTIEDSKILNYLNSKDLKYYDNLRQKRMHKIVETEQLSKRDKIQQLNKQADKIDAFINRKSALNKVKRKKNNTNNEEDDEEITQMLLASVKAKVGMLEILKHGA